ncbi:MAG: metalloregulator ArsR/SmtB family transcription factor, partial [Gammaproteobacteria bacterium]|nr:metalloregulator ArsR/SmtB family transcription factor [Gammaproteobacteria bacterium]
RTKPAGCCAPALVRRMPSAQLRRLAGLAKALADTNRLEILRLLARQAGPICACDIVDHLDLSQPTVSHHLKILKEAGLLRASRNGLWMFYALAPDAAQTLGNLAGLIEA